LDLDDRGHGDNHPVYPLILFQHPEFFFMNTIVCFRCYVSNLTMLPVAKFILCWWAGRWWDNIGLHVERPVTNLVIVENDLLHARERV
jgi:hypothetical protein